MMRLVLLLALLSTTGCGLFTTGEGTFNGRLVDVGVHGLIFKSCEVGIQVGEQSSQMVHASSVDTSLCKSLSGLVGNNVKLSYQTWAKPCCLRVDDPDEIIQIVKEN